MQKLAILGAGGHAREQLDLLAELNRREPRYDVLGFVVDPEFAVEGERLRDLPVRRGLDWLSERSDEVLAVCGIGDSRQRLHVVRRAEGVGVRFATIVHPSAQVGPAVELGAGVIVSAGAVLTSDVRVGAHVHVNVGCLISHDCGIGDHASLAPGVQLSGHVRIGEGCRLGAGTVVGDRRSIGRWTTTGAGAVVVDDLPDDCVAVGVPARVIETRAAGWQLAADPPPARKR